MVSFIDNVIVWIEKEKKYNKVVKEVVKRLVKNDLYIKPEKYKWKIREIRFLEVVIGLEEIKIEEKKIKIVLDWLTSNEIKNV